MKKLPNLSFFSTITQKIKENYFAYQANRIAQTYSTDPIIDYPSYKSMDEYINIERLKSLDDNIKDLIHSYINSNKIKEDNFRNLFTLNPLHPKMTKTRFIPLTEHENVDNYQYLDINNPHLWKWTPYAKKLPELIDFIYQLPFKDIARVLLLFDTGGNAVTCHRDHAFQHICHEFIWLRSNFKKQFYVYHAGKKNYITSYSAWFDTVNQFHGAAPVNELNFSIRVDGIFSDHLRKLIPKPTINLASTPSYWSALTKK